MRAEERAQESQRGPLLPLSLPSSLGFQIVAQKKMTRPLLLRFGRNAGKSTITVSPRAAGRGVLGGDKQGGLRWTVTV